MSEFRAVFIDNNRRPTAQLKCDGRVLAAFKIYSFRFEFGFRELYLREFRSESNRRGCGTECVSVK